MAKQKLAEVVKRLKMEVTLLVIIIAIMVIYIGYTAVAPSLKPVPVGQRLTGIDSPLSTPQLAVINNASNNNFEIAGEKLLNLSINGEQGLNNSFSGPLFETSLASALQANAPLVINGKPSVIYIGAISCIYCGENRWAMALALSRFGSFNKLYTGYSSLGDGDLPTLYWSYDNYTSNGTITYGNGYQSNYINFFSAEYDSPITAGFQFPQLQNPISLFVARAPNSSYSTAMQFMNGSRQFTGTPFTFWGRSLNRGADAVVFGNATSQTSTTTNLLPISYMTHQQIYDQFQQFNSTFAYEEYAAADVYVAQVCPSINNAASVCSLPAIRVMESKMGLA